MDTDVSPTPPPLAPDRAAALLAERWGLAASLTEIGSYEDQNFEVRAGERRFVLKCERRSLASLALEHRAIGALAAALPALDLPEPVPTLVGGPGHELPGGLCLRLLTWVPGTGLDDLPDLDDASLHALGALAARVGEALAPLDPGEGSPELKWDPRLAGRVVEGVLAEDPLPSAEEASTLRAAIAPLTAAAQAASAAELPLQLIHGDITDHNTLAAVGGSRPTGLIDFGDVCRTWRIADLAAACVALACRRPGDPLEASLAVLAGYHAATPLPEAEADLLWPLILARAAACAALSVRQRRLTPGSAYVRAMDASDWVGLRGLLAVPEGLGRAAIRHACGHPPLADHPAAEPAPAGSVVEPGPAATLDLSIGSPLLHDGAWTDPARLAAALGDGPALGRWGEVRLTASGAPADLAPATLHLGADVLCAPGTAVRAPLPGRVVRADPAELWLALDDPAPAGHLRLGGVTPALALGVRVSAGTTVAAVAARADGGPARVHVQLAPAPTTPGLGSPRLREAWLALCPDPSALVGRDVRAPAPPDPAAALARRQRVLAGAQELYYREPLATVRGWRQYLYDDGGRPYLDMVNNVASVGHSHPRIADAAARQFRMLNTNSRFLYGSMTVYAERLSALLPPELDTVFLVNSGSEACDLALQIARAATGRTDLVALQGAYHGWTGAVFEACTSPADNPGWTDTKPPTVHLAAQPDPYRGRFGADAGAYVDSVADACRAASAGRGGGPAAFISESLLGNQGAVEPPPGYLAAAYRAVRAAGGLCIADEIQVGYGRTGETFWAFTHEQVVPDIVAVAKAAGNGHPIGAVICRRELADALGDRAAFFSSTGGGPVSCEVGITVLDVIADERLQENAASVGAGLKRALTAVADRHPAIGAVHGRGLYLGVDLVRDRATRAPDRPRALAVCERMRRLGIVGQPTGDGGNVLKVKPPLCLRAADAERFVAVLDRALTDVAAWL